MYFIGQLCRKMYFRWEIYDESGCYLHLLEIYNKINRIVENTTITLEGQRKMIIKTSSGRSFDTDRDLSAAERHIVQKLMAWESLVTSREQFMQKKTDALLKGWENSGPVTESPALRDIIKDIEKKVVVRLNEEPL